MSKPSTKTISTWSPSPSSTPRNVVAPAATDRTSTRRRAASARRPLRPQGPSDMTTIGHSESGFAAGRPQRLVAFEQRFAAERRRKRLWTLLQLGLFAVALVGSIVVSDFNVNGLMNGLPKAWNY